MVAELQPDAQTVYVAALAFPTPKTPQKEIGQTKNPKMKKLRRKNLLKLIFGLAFKSPPQMFLRYLFSLFLFFPSPLPLCTQRGRCPTRFVVALARRVGQRGFLFLVFKFLTPPYPPLLKGEEEMRADFIFKLITCFQ